MCESANSSARHVDAVAPTSITKQLTLPRISAASGGLRPDVDQIRLSEIDENDDLDRLAHSSAAAAERKVRGSTNNQ
jgi:hypothetical protein